MFCITIMIINTITIVAWFVIICILYMYNTEKTSNITTNQLVSYQFVLYL